MDAAADYAVIRRALANADLPAYVSYTVHTHAGFDALHGEETTTLTVRTSDGAIVSGKRPKLVVDVDRSSAADVLRHGPFQPACYAALRATLATFEQRPAEAITLRSVCHPADGASRETNHSVVFSTLYADPLTHLPLAAVGDTAAHHVNAHVDERFTRVAGFVLPAALHVTVAGNGPMFWLNVDAGQTYGDYRFLSHAP